MVDVPSLFGRVGYHNGYADGAAAKDEEYKTLVDAALSLEASFPTVEHVVYEDGSYLNPSGSMLASEHVVSLRQALDHLGEK